jgi:predicted metal-dependent peptidase
MQAARFTLVSLKNQSIGRFATRYAHRVDMDTSGIAYARHQECVYGPRFAKLHRYSQSFVMAHEVCHHFLGHIPQGALLYRLSPKSFSFKGYNIACDVVVNAICEALPNDKTATSAGGYTYAVRRCQELGIVNWAGLCEQMRRIAEKGGIELDETFTKEVTDVNSIQIYNAMMRTIRRRAAERKTARTERDIVEEWEGIVGRIAKLVSVARNEPSTLFATDPIDLGPVDLHDMIAALVRTYSRSEDPADHESAGDVDDAAWDPMMEAIEGFVQTAMKDGFHVFAENPIRRSHALSQDLRRVIAVFDPKDSHKDDEEQDEDAIEESEETIIDQLADEMNAQDDLREAIEEAAKRPESDLNNDVARNDSEFRRHQSGIGHGDVLKKVCPPGGLTGTPWGAKLRRLLNSALVARMSLDPRRPSRRTVSSTYEAMRPGADRSVHNAIAHIPFLKRRTEATRAELILDTSSSIFANRVLMARLVQECETIAKSVHSSLRITFADTDVCESVEIGEAQHLIRTLIPRGGGGTDFRKAIAAAEARNPDVIIYMTDLCGTFPEKKPRCPIIWAYPSDFAEMKTPFGQRIELA